MGSVSAVCPAGEPATSLKPVRQLLDATLKIDHHRSLPKYSHGTFRRWYKSVAADRARYADRRVLPWLLRELQPSATG